MKKGKSKNSIVDDLRGVEKLGGDKPIQQLYESKASHPLNEEIIPDLSTVTFPKIKNNEKG
jgi:hypothetical protein